MPTHQLVVRDGESRRTFARDAFPLSLGGPDADLPLPGQEGTVAWLDWSEGDLFIQPESPGALRLGGRMLDDSRWIRPGDRLAVGAAWLRFALGDDGLELTVEAPGERTVPKLRPPTGPRPGAEPGGIRPMEFRPARAESAGPAVAKPRRRLWPKLLAATLLAMLLAVAVGLFTARSVGFKVEPVPDRLEVRSGLALPLGERFLMWPGRYAVAAEKAGYRPLEAEIEVGRDSRQEVTLSLEKLPGRLKVRTADALTGLAVSVDGRPAGETPLELELEAGEYRVGIEDDRFRPFEQAVEVPGLGQTVELEAELEPRWAQVRLSSKPAGARIRVDGEDRGRTPADLELIEGTRRFELVLAGHKPYRGKVEVTAGEDQAPDPVVLRPSDGNLTVTSVPEEAEVTVGGVYRGRTPTDLFLAPDRDHRLRLTKVGYAPVERTVRLSSGEAEELRLELERLMGRVEVRIFPPDAEILVDGKPVAPRDGALELPAIPHRIQVRKAGYVPFETRITPLPGVPQTLEAQLESEAVVEERKIRNNLETVEGHLLALVEPGRLRMGASRREAGRRANEALREVELTRRFYIGRHEVTNAQFRRFRADHRSGGIGEQNLELDDHPVVRVSRQDAVAYCNWLSEQEGLPAAYVKEGETWIAVSPMNEGFRLPTEAEWAWVARYDAAGNGPRKYPWGESLPPTEGAGNFADRSAADLVAVTLEDYRDGFPATAPVTAFTADSRGIHQLGGNVAEWMHDVYKVRPAMVGAVERDPLGPPRGDLHVIRGSSFLHSTITELRLSFRDYGSEPRPDLGFRIARYVEGAVP